MGVRLSHHDIPTAFHGSPTDAAAIHLDTKSRNTIGIHFGTFVGSENETCEATIELAEACHERGIQGLEDDSEEKGQGRAGTLDIGASLVVKLL
jgi:hypothetical protein